MRCDTMRCDRSTDVRRDKLKKKKQWYDPESDCWTDSGELFDLPYKRLRYCAATVATDGRIFIFGGQAIDETTTENYSIEDTVNWYQVSQSISQVSETNSSTLRRPSSARPARTHANATAICFLSLQ